MDAGETQTTVLLEQPVESSCEACRLTQQTCILAGACKHAACIAWQQWDLQSTIHVRDNTTYLFRLRDWAPLAPQQQPPAARHMVVPSVGVSPTASNQGGLSSLLLNPRLTHQMTQFTFRTMMGTEPDASLPDVRPVPSQEPHSSPLPQTSTTAPQEEPKQATALSTTSIALVVVIALLIVLAVAAGCFLRRYVNTRAKVGLDLLPHRQTHCQTPDAPASKRAWAAAPVGPVRHSEPHVYYASST